MELGGREGRQYLSWFRSKWSRQTARSISILREAWARALVNQWLHLPITPKNNIQLSELMILESAVM